MELLATLENIDDNSDFWVDVNASMVRGGGEEGRGFRFKGF